MNLPYRIALLNEEIAYINSSLTKLKEAKISIIDGYYDGYIDTTAFLDLSFTLPILDYWTALLTFNTPQNIYFDVKLGTSISVIKSDSRFLETFRRDLVEQLILIWRKYAGYNTFIDLLSY